MISLGIRRGCSIVAFIVCLVALGLLPYASFQLAERAKINLESQQALSKFNANQLAAIRSSHTLASAKDLQAREDTVLAPSKGLGLAGAELQSLLSQVIRDRSGRPGSLQVLSPKVEGGLTRISVEAVFTASNEAFRNIILDVERHVPFVFVDQLSIRMLSQRDVAKASPLVANSEKNEREKLEISITASNYMKADGVLDKRFE